MRIIDRGHLSRGLTVSFANQIKNLEEERDIAVSETTQHRFALQFRLVDDGTVSCALWCGLFFFAVSYFELTLSHIFRSKYNPKNNHYAKGTWGIRASSTGSQNML